MGKKKRASTAAWRAAAATPLSPHTTTSPATQLVATVALADSSGTTATNEPSPALAQQPTDSHPRTACPAPRISFIAMHTTTKSSISASAPPDGSSFAFEHPEPRRAPTQQQHNAHAVNTCPAPRVSSLAHPTSPLALHMTIETTHGVPAAQADIVRPPAVVVEPYAHHAATTDESHEPRGPNTCQTLHTASPALNTYAATPYDVPLALGSTVPSRAAGNEVENKVGARREGLDGAHGEYMPLALRGTGSVQHTPLAPPTASPAPHIRTATPHDVLASPRRTTHTRAAENESRGLVGARKDDMHAPHARTTPHAPPPVQCAIPAAPNEVPASAHNNVEPPTPGIEPGAPHMAAANEPCEEPAPPHAEQDLVDRAYHDDMVAIAIRKGFEAGVKEGRNTGFREGLEAGARPRQNREEGRKEEIARNSVETNSPRNATCDAQRVSNPAPLATSIAEIDTDLLARVRKEAEYGIWEEGLEAGMTMGRKEGREAGYSEGLEAGRKMGMMEGRERGFEDGKSAGVQAGRVLERVEVCRIVRPSVHVQTDNRPVRTYINAAVRTSESLPTPRADVAMQTLPLYAAAMPLIEDPDPALLDPTHLKEIVVTALSDGHAAGLKEGWHVGLQEGTATGRKMGMIEGRERGFDEGKSAGVKIGRDLECAAVRRIVCCSVHVQTDTLLGNVRTLADSATRLGERRHPICIDSPAQTKPSIHIESAAQKVPKTDPIPTALSPAPFSWADDADSLPLIPVLPLCSTSARDFSDLRSSLVSQPFGSIQRRVRRSQRHTNQALQFRRYRSPPSASSSWRSSIQPAHPIHPVQRRASDLEWATDPRLSELSRVLQGLGWVHSSFSLGQVSEATRTLPCRRGAHGVGRLGLPPSRGWVSSGV